MKIDHPLKQIRKLVRPIILLKTCVNVYTRLFTKGNRGLVNVYKRLGEDGCVDNQIVVEMEEIALWGRYGYKQVTSNPK